MFKYETLVRLRGKFRLSQMLYKLKLIKKVKKRKETIQQAEKAPYSAMKF